ncbi:sensor histidine kinase [Tessaracoccus antarcticus]|nr:sensor histidine kinase [Tessaracoccus antarcticus]
MEALPERSRRRTGPRTRSGGLSRRLLKDTATMGDSLRLVGFAAFEVLAMLRFAVTALLSLLGFGGLDGAFDQVRWDADNQRRWASTTGTREVSASYEEPPAVAPGGLAQVRAQLCDPARARDLDWHLLNPVATVLGAAVPWGLVLSGLYVGLQGFFFPGDTFFLLGSMAVMLVLAPPLARLVQRLHRRWVRFMLAGEVSDNLEERVRTLTATRMTALDMQEAEIQRIERDLHDGAQARLVTIGMTITQASRLMRHDPDATLALLDDVKNDSATALQELRTLVRGIRPPVLADRGLPDALRALAASSPIDTDVTSSLEGRLVGSVESALFFAVSELLTNAIKHSSASRVTMTLSESEGNVVVEVFDDGLGGAEGQDVAGGGIAGIRRRLAPFDGTLDFVSPVGGGTFATIRVPRPIA